MVRVPIDSADYDRLSRACRDGWRARLVGFPSLDGEFLEMAPSEWRLVLELIEGVDALREFRGKLAEVLV